jgi:hypothetical protein
MILLHIILPATSPPALGFPHVFLKSTRNVLSHFERLAGLGHPTRHTNISQTHETDSRFVGLNIQLTVRGTEHPTRPAITSEKHTKRTLYVIEAQTAERS